MSTSRPSVPTLAERHAAQTREVILEALAACLSEVVDGVDVPLSVVARRAGVSERTLYRHFPTRADLLAGFAAWFSDRVMPVLRWERFADLPGVYTEAMRLMDEQPQHSRTAIMSGVGRDALSGFRSEIRSLLESAISRELPLLEPQMRRRALGALLYLNSMTPWLVLRDELDMTGEEIGQSIGWVIGLVVANLQTSPPVDTKADIDMPQL